MINLFLKAKHWQLFSLLFGIPLIFQIFMMVSTLSAAMSAEPGDPKNLSTILIIFSLLIFLSVGTLFGWLWSVGVGLQVKVPPNVKMKVGRFKIFLIIPMVYISLLCVVIVIAISGVMRGGPEPDEVLVLPVIALHLFSMFCMFYLVYFVAKTIKTVELQRETSFSDFVGEFFMIWFYIIGIWILQPKINKMVAESESLIP